MNSVWCHWPRLSLVDGDPVCRGEPFVALDVVDSVLQVAVAFGQVHLQQVPQQVLQVGAEVGRESNLERGRSAQWNLACVHATRDAHPKSKRPPTFPETIFS